MIIGHRLCPYAQPALESGRRSADPSGPAAGFLGAAQDGLLLVKGSAIYPCLGPTLKLCGFNSPSGSRGSSWSV